MARSLTVDELATLRRADVVVLASGSAAVALSGAGGAGAVVAIGPVTADAAGDAGLTVAAIAATPSDDDVVAAVLTVTDR